MRERVDAAAMVRRENMAGVREKRVRVVVWASGREKWRVPLGNRSIGLLT